MRKIRSSFQEKIHLNCPLFVLRWIWLLTTELEQLISNLQDEIGGLRLKQTTSDDKYRDSFLNNLLDFKVRAHILAPCRICFLLRRTNSQIRTGWTQCMYFILWPNRYSDQSRSHGLCSHGADEPSFHEQLRVYYFLNKHVGGLHGQSVGFLNS